MSKPTHLGRSQRFFLLSTFSSSLCILSSMTIREGNTEMAQSRELKRVFRGADKEASLRQSPLRGSLSPICYSNKYSQEHSHDAFVNFSLFNSRITSAWFAAQVSQSHCIQVCRPPVYRYSTHGQVLQTTNIHITHPAQSPPSQPAMTDLGLPEPITLRFYKTLKRKKRGVSFS